MASSPLVLFNLEDYYHPGERILFDIKDFLFHGMILKEKDFREAVKNYDWSTMEGKNVAVYCSADAIIPTWAYMLLATVIESHANLVVFGDLEALEQALFQGALSNISWEKFQDAKVVVKGCGKIPVPAFAYVEATRQLRKYAASIMYGEPCSTVPLYKRRK